MLLAAFGLYSLSSGSAIAQSEADDRPDRGGGLRVEAYAGEPFGVARIVVPIDDAPPTVVQHTQGLLIEADRSVSAPLYPAFHLDGQLDLGTGLLRELLSRRPRSISCLFLFRSDGPFRVTLHLPDPLEVEVRPVVDARAHRRTLRAWWLRYQGMARQAEREHDAPVLADTYLMGMLGQRLNLEPSFGPNRRSPPDDIPTQTLGLVLMPEWSEPHWASRQWEVDDFQIADQPLPQPPRWPWNGETSRLSRQDSAQLPPLEPLASYVPAECFYLRFGRFNNYLWLKSLLQDQGGEISRLVSLRGQMGRDDEGPQIQLGLEETALARLLGETAIADMAIIGHDLYVRDGASIGVLFQGLKSDVLARQLNQQRRAAWQAIPEARRVEQTWQHRGVSVHYLGSVDHRFRSISARVGDFHLVANSAELVRRYIDAAQGDGRLSDDADFRAARRHRPATPDQLLSAFFSRPFQAQLLSPHYQIELRRRRWASMDLRTVMLAELAARAEGHQPTSLGELARRGMLPAGLVRRLDAAREAPAITRLDDEWIDAVRGRRGSMLPVLDVPIERATIDEVERYEKLRAHVEQHWGHLDPLELVIQRDALDSPRNHYRLTVDARFAPFDRTKYGIAATLLAPVTNQRIAAGPDVIASIQAHLQGGLLAPSVGSHQVMLGVVDTDPRRLPIGGRLLRVVQIVRSVPAFLTAWPKPGLLDLLPVGFRPTSRAEGLERQSLGIYRQQTEDGFAAISFHPSVLSDVVPQLSMVEAPREAQLVLDVGNLANSQLGEWIDALSRERAQRASIGNARLMNRLTQQFRLARSEGRHVAEQLLNVRLVCPLGGDYRVTPMSSSEPTPSEPDESPEFEELPAPADESGEATTTAAGYWAPTALEIQSRQRASQFRSPLMGWFRGTRAWLVMEDHHLDLHAEMLIETDAQVAPLRFPRWQIPGTDAGK